MLRPLRTYQGLIKLRKSGNSYVLSVPSKFQPKGRVSYKVQETRSHQIIYTPVHKQVNLFDTPKWRHFNRRSYLKKTGVGTDTNLVGKEKYDE